LSEFVQSNRFPTGAFYLKDFRWKDRTALSLFADPEKYKPKLIEPLLKKFPQRQFVLVGDSGERDPEIYGALARKFPDQIKHIFIRDVTPQQTGKERYRTAFRNLAAEDWTVFREPGELLSEVSKLFSSSGQ
jgi:phosphatidate phosphatase APP1